MSKTVQEDNLQDVITKHMRRDFVQLNIDLNVSQALEQVREKQPEGRIIYFYVTNAEGKLEGVVPTRRLLLSAGNQPLREIMVKSVIAIPESATVLDACEFFTMHKLLAFPVVDAQKRIVGLVDVDMYTEELSDLEKREGNDDLFQLIGVHLTETQQGRPWLAFKQRFPWLLANIAGGIAAAFLSGFYEVELQKVVALALFIPVVLALAESVSIQSVSLALQTLHGQRPTWSALLNKLSREVLTGVFLGVACGFLVGMVALLWIGQPLVSITILGGIGGGVTAAALIGIGIPNLLYMLQRDPQVAAGPIALAMTDMVTLLLYFNLARWLLS